MSATSALTQWLLGDLGFLIHLTCYYYYWMLRKNPRMHQFNKRHSEREGRSEEIVLVEHLYPCIAAGHPVLQGATVAPACAQLRHFHQNRRDEGLELSEA